MNTVAQCLREGPLKNENITTVGHADPRGSDAYNRGLGMQRAESARDYLVSIGVPASRITVLSRGEQQAMGTGPESWQLDRRVEVDVATAR